MSTISTIAVDFIANAGKYIQGLTQISNQTKTFASSAKKDTDSVSAAFDKLSRQIDGVVVASALKKIVDFAKGAAAEIGKINDIAETTGMSIREVQALKFVGSQTGNDINELVSGLERMNSKLQDARIKGGDAALTFADMGIELKKFNEMTNSERLVVLARYIENATDKSYAWSNVQDLLGDKLGPKMRAALMTYVDGVDAVIKKTEEANQMMGEDFVKSMDAASKKIDGLTSRLKVLSSAAIIGGAEGLGEWAARVVLEFEKIGASENELRAIEEAQLESRKRSIENNIEFSKSLGGVDLELYQSQLKEVTDALDKLYAANKKIDDQNRARRTGGATATTAVKTPVPEPIPLSAINDQLKAISRMDNLGDRIKKLQELTVTYAGQARLLKPITDELEKENDAAVNLGKAYKALIDPLYAYGQEVNKINSAKMSPEDRQKAIDALANPYIFALDPAKKYGAEIEKINAIGTLSSKQKSDSTRLLAKEYFDIIEPARKYQELIKELDFFLVKGIVTDKEKIQILNNLGGSYRQAYDALEKYRDVIRQINALPPEANVDKEKYIRSLGDAYRENIDPMFKYVKQLNEIISLNQIAYSKPRPVPFRNETIRALSAEEAVAARKVLDYNLQIEATKQRAMLTGNDTIAAEARRMQTMLEINKTFADNNLKTDKDAALKAEAIQEMQLQYFKDTHKEMTAIYQNLGGNVVTAFEDMLLAGKSFRDGMHDVFMSLTRDLLNFLLKQYLFKNIFNAIGLPLFGVAEMGQLMYGGPRAMGGPVSSGTAYTVGESGPEMFVPGTNGYILPNGMGSGETIIVNQTINVETGVSQTVRAEMATLLPRFKQEAMTGVLEAKSRGGSYARGLTA
jgi:hypothetical protein